MPGHVVAPLRQVIHCSSVCMAQVSEIELESRTLNYLGEGTSRIAYDQLVLAIGVQSNLGKGMAQYALPLKTLGDALSLRNRIIARLEQAELQPDPEARRWLTTFVVIGGGFSGVETAGELIDFLHASLRYYPRIRREDIGVVLLHGQDRLLPELSPSLGEFAYRKMRMQGLEVRLNARAVRIDDRHVTLADGELIPAGTVVSTIGTVPNPLVSELPLPRIAAGLRRIPTCRCRAFRRSGRWATAQPSRTRAAGRSRRLRRSSEAGRRAYSRAASQATCGAARHALSTTSR